MSESTRHIVLKHVDKLERDKCVHQIMVPKVGLWLDIMFSDGDTMFRASTVDTFGVDTHFGYLVLM